jgi:hypothetical protein
MTRKMAYDFFTHLELKWASDLGVCCTEVSFNSDTQGGVYDLYMLPDISLLFMKIVKYEK